MNYGGLFDWDTKSKRINELEIKMKDPDFWNDKRESEKVINELNALKAIIDMANSIKEEIELCRYSLDENDFDYPRDNQTKVASKLEELEMQVLLNGLYDQNNALLEIHSGAGGTEACDWADMLYRMYKRWCEKHNYKIDVIDEVKGGEVGYKSISLVVKGHNAYGYLKSEKGIHRLVRISPFDSNKRRHTSFASVEVTPVIENNNEITIDDKDLRIDVYRSTGAGGQGVNTTDSAVRITHIPTKIVVTCQNERSQLQNKERCMQILKSKLIEIELEKQKQELNKIKGNQKEINFGSQIRSYVMCPYTLVKDHRTNKENPNVNKVLDGDIDEFINEYLKGN